MTRINPTQPHESLAIQIFKPNYRSEKRLPVLFFLIYLAVWTALFYMISGCSSTSPQRLQAHFESEPQATEVIRGKLSAQPQDRLPVGLAIVLDTGGSQAPVAITENTWPQFAARVKHEAQKHFPVSMQEVIQLERIPSGEAFGLMKGISENSQIEAILVVLSSGKEVRGPAQFNVLPEVGTLNGYQVENHAIVELGLLDTKSGKLLLQSQGRSFAILEQLDSPMASNRYPKVTGSAMTNPIFPEDRRALETLRIVALNEALDQAIMKLEGKWPTGLGKPKLAAPAQGSVAPSELGI
ncbi:MAG: hypothetical protein WD032_01210 [Nitrospirales bacterium]